MRTRETFYKDTGAIFARCPRPRRKPDYVSFSGSRYWYTDHGVYRYSDHWGEVASCWWLLGDRRTARASMNIGRRWLTGHAAWSDFTDRENVLYGGWGPFYIVNYLSVSFDRKIKARTRAEFREMAAKMERKGEPWYWHYGRPCYGEPILRDGDISQEQLDDALRKWTLKKPGRNIIDGMPVWKIYGFYSDPIGFVVNTAGRWYVRIEPDADPAFNGWRDTEEQIEEAVRCYLESIRLRQTHSACSGSHAHKKRVYAHY